MKSEETQKTESVQRLDDGAMIPNVTLETRLNEVLETAETALASGYPLVGAIELRRSILRARDAYRERESAIAEGDAKLAAELDLRLDTLIQEVNAQSDEFVTQVEAGELEISSGVRQKTDSVIVAPENWDEPKPSEKLH